MRMKCCILFASPRAENSNTLAMVKPFMEEWKTAGHTADFYSLYDMDIEPCRACRSCQSDWSAPACVLHDDMDAIFDSVLSSDLIVLASPIYSWYCTAPLKAALDRMVYALNKYYGGKHGPSIWQGRRVAIITSCGYRCEKGTDLFEEGIIRYCKHSGLKYDGMIAQRHLGYDVPFMDQEREQQVRAFARKLMNL